MSQEKMMRKSEISASMMCADLVHLRETVEIFEKTGIEYLHIDVMDGEFVPNFGLGADYIRGLRELTDIPLDIHLMIKNPEYKFQWIGIEKNDIVSIHYESTYQLQRALDRLVSYGCMRFLAISPATPICVLEEVLDYIDGVNVLMVNPGYAGQRMVPSTMKKVKKLRDFLVTRKKENIILEADGNISEENGAKLRGYGTSIFVAGSTGIFNGDIQSYESKIIKLKKAIQ